MDYPAAHSMDTDWFAVDEHGRIAYLESGEEGAVPEGIWSDEGYETLGALIREAGPIILKRAEALLGHHARDDDPELRYQPAVLLVRDPGAVAARCPDYKSHALWPRRARLDDFGPPGDTPAGQLYPILLHMWNQEYEAIHRDDLCAGCTTLGRLGRLGIFVYTNEEYMLPPYQRIDAPLVPLTIDELPAVIAQRFEAGRLPGADFASAAQLQPIEHTRCQVWGGETYIGADGAERPLPESVTRLDSLPPLPPPETLWERLLRVLGRR